MKDKQKLASYLTDNLEIYNDGKTPIVLSTDIYDLLVKFEESLSTTKPKEASESNSNKTQSAKNPMHYCMNGCGKYIDHRGYCSKKCHDKYYDSLAD